MSAKLFEFPGNPRPRVTQRAPAIVLILPVMRVEKENDVVDLYGLRFVDWGPSPWMSPPNCRCTLVDWNDAVKTIMEES